MLVVAVGFSNVERLGLGHGRCGCEVCWPADSAGFVATGGPAFLGPMQLSSGSLYMHCMSLSAKFHGLSPPWSQAMLVQRKGNTSDTTQQWLTEQKLKLVAQKNAEREAETAAYKKEQGSGATAGPRSVAPTPTQV